MIRKLIPYVLVAGITAFAAWQLRPAPEVQYRDVIVPQEVLVEAAPDTIVQWRDRIIYRTVEPTVVARSAERDHIGISTAFCGPQVHNNDTTVVSDIPETWLLSSLKLTTPWTPWGRSTLQLTGPLSGGGMQQARYDVRLPLQAALRGSSALVQTSRWWWVGPLVYTAAVGTAGYTLGRIQP